MNTVAFEFYVEPSAGGEVTWKVTADITFEHGRSWADITGAHPEDAREYPSLYDASDLEQALAEEGDGRTIEDVKQAAIDAFVSACDAEAS